MTTRPNPRHENPFRGSTTQVPGLYPHTNGARPVPLAYASGTPVSFDPSQWTAAGQDQTSDRDDSVLVFGLNGFGKSVLHTELLELDRRHDTDVDAPIDLDVPDPGISDGDTESSDSGQGQL